MFQLYRSVCKLRHIIRVNQSVVMVLDQAIPEYALDDRQLDELFDIFPTVRMIQTDVPAELIAALEKKGLR